MFRRHVRNEKGFTMIEMMVVLIIIAVLIGGGIKFYIGYIDKSKVTKAKADITTMQAGLDSYYVEKNEYPNGDDADAVDLLLKEAGLSNDIVSSDTDKTYQYLVTVDKKGYAINTTAKVDGTNFVTGTGRTGRSGSPAILPDPEAPTEAPE